VEGGMTARDAVVALGPWTDVLTRALGYDLPLAVKRGYHMHYRPAGEAKLNNPMLDTERGYFLAPMRRGIRLTTGAEFALRDAIPTPVQRRRGEAPSFGDVALRADRHHLAQRIQHRGVLVLVALPRREVGALHPLVLFREVRLREPGEGLQARRKVLVAAGEQRIDPLDELT